MELQKNKKMMTVLADECFEIFRVFNARVADRARPSASDAFLRAHSPPDRCFFPL